jgi:hypothetical protein
MTIRFGLFLILASASWLSAATIYSDLGPGDSYFSIPYSSGASGGNYLAVDFVATGSGALGLISVPLSSTDTTPTGATVDLYAGSSSAPIALLETWNITLPGNFIQSPQQTIPLVTLNSVDNPLLTAGQSYWFVIEPTTDGVFWAINNQNVIGTIWYGDALGSLQSYPVDDLPAQAIDVEGTPEAVSGSLFGLGCGLLALYSLRKRSSSVCGND